jgi:hypothetical protein
VLRAPRRYFNGFAYVDAVWPLHVTTTRATLMVELGGATQRDKVCEHDLKGRGVTFRVTLEGDTWRRDVGNGDTNDLNVALIRALHSASDARRLEGDAAPSQRQAARGLTSPFLNYAAEILRPEHVVRLSDTIVELRLPPCTSALGAASFELCRRVTNETAFGSAEEIAFVVPSTATASSSGYLVARPIFRVSGTLSSVQLSLHRDGTLSPLPDGIGDVTTTTTAGSLLPLHFSLHARCGSWNDGLVRASGEIARFTGEGIPTAVGELIIINSTVAALTLVDATCTAQSDGPSFVQTRILVRPEWLVADRSLAAMLTPTAARNVTVETVPNAPTFAWLWPRR